MSSSFGNSFLEHYGDLFPGFPGYGDLFFGYWKSQEYFSKKHR